MTLRRRWIWLIGMPLYTVLMVPVGTVLLTLAVRQPESAGPLGWLEDAWDLLTDLEWWWMALICCAIIAASQFVFLLPVVRLTPPTGTRSRRLSVSLLVGAVVAAVLALSMALALVELIVSFTAAFPTKAPGPTAATCWTRAGFFPPPL